MTFKKWNPKISFILILFLIVTTYNSINFSFVVSVNMLKGGHIPLFP